MFKVSGPVIGLKQVCDAWSMVMAGLIRTLVGLEIPLSDKVPIWRKFHVVCTFSGDIAVVR